MIFRHPSRVVSCKEHESWCYYYTKTTKQSWNCMVTLCCSCTHVHGTENKLHCHCVNPSCKRMRNHRRISYWSKHVWCSFTSTYIRGNGHLIRTKKTKKHLDRAIISGLQPENVHRLAIERVRIPALSYFNGNNNLVSKAFCMTGCSWVWMHSHSRFPLASGQENVTLNFTIPLSVCKNGPRLFCQITLFGTDEKTYRVRVYKRSVSPKPIPNKKNTTFNSHQNTPCMFKQNANLTTFVLYECLTVLAMETSTVLIQACTL